MLKDAVSIQLRGANFETNTVLPLLKRSDDKYTKIALLYGRNGSGKSTIANAFRKISDQECSAIEYASLLDSSNQPVQLSSQEKEAISVFNKDFVTNNIKIKPDGLDSIVMLGEQVGLSEQFEIAENELNAAKEELKRANTLFEEYRNRLNPKSPEYILRKIHDMLQNDNGWAGRDRIIKDGKKNSNVTDETYKSFLHLAPEMTRDELLVAFSEAEKLLEETKKGSGSISESVPVLPKDMESFSAEKLEQLLKIKIECPELSDRERTLLSLVSNDQPESLKTRIDVFEDEKTQYCPYCLQDLNNGHKTHLVSVLHAILSETVENHQSELDSFLIHEFEPDLSAFSSLGSHTKVIRCIKALNESVRNNNDLIQRKIADPYTPVFSDVVDLSPILLQLENALFALQSEKEMHNAEVSNTEKIKERMQEVNNQIAYYDIIDLAHSIETQINEKKKAENESGKALENYYLKKRRLDELNSKRKRIDIAAKMINDELKYIFFSDNRLSIQIEMDRLKLLVNGKPVSPNHVSDGECNILALCYFFTTLLTERSKEDAYQVERLIVIDDPISSFDYENRIGILSYLKYKLDMFLSGNNNSRAIVMTHDLSAYYSIGKICCQIQNEWKQNNRQPNTKYCLWELSNRSISCLKDYRHEYTKLLRIIYDYGKGNADEYDIIIGNIMRQTLEAFSTFEYRKGIEDVATDKAILDEASSMNDHQRVYFRNLMYRLVLNSGSHRREQVESLDVDFLSMISEKEKRRTARDILCFIYLLNKSHIKAHLVNEYHDIEAWSNNIK